MTKKIRKRDRERKRERERERIKHVMEKRELNMSDNMCWM